MYLGRAHCIPGRVLELPATPCVSSLAPLREWPGRPGQVRDTNLVIPAADAELAAQAVGAGAVIHTGAVLWRQRQ